MYNRISSPWKSRPWKPALLTSPVRSYIGQSARHYMVDINIKWEGKKKLRNGMTLRIRDLRDQRTTTVKSNGAIDSITEFDFLGNMVKRLEIRVFFFWLLTLLLDTSRIGGSSYCSSPFINLDILAAFIFIKVWVSFHSQCEYRRWSVGWSSQLSEVQLTASGPTSCRGEGEGGSVED